MISRIKIWGAAVLGVLSAIGAAFIWGKKSGKEDLTNQQAKDSLDAQEKGRKAVLDGRNSGLTPDERMQRNDEARL